MSGVVTFLFTDVEGSTRLWDEHPDAMAPDLAQHDVVVRASIEAAGGRVFSTAGDAFAAAFETPASALRAAVEAQHRLAATHWATPGIRVRMALHSGVAQERGGDFFGPPLNRAARLLSAGHGGQILVSGATHELVQHDAPALNVSFTALGQHRLKDLEHPEQVFQVVGDGLVPQFPPLKTLDSVPNNLPSTFSSFVGREQELEGLAKVLSHGRLATVTGAGGVGKSRLAVEFGLGHLGAFVDGVWLAELAPLTDPSLLAREVLGQLRLPPPISKAPLATLADELRNRSMLIILDNCEHVVDEAARVVRTILEAAPAVRVLATSRHPLGLSGEAVWALPPLDIGADTEPAVEAEAVRLFVDRLPPTVELSDADIDAVQGICRRLDGLPLAIELAAARLRSLSLDELDRRLDDRFRVLTGRDPTALPHHRTLLATVDWSYELLDESEREVYRRLAVFRSSFDLAAAEAVAASARVDPGDVLDAVEGLVSQSLLGTESAAGTGRYRMLQTVREHAGRQLRDNGEDDDAHRALLRWAVTFARTAGPGLQGPQQQQWNERVALEVDNLRAALDWALHHDPVTGLDLTTPLSPFWWLHGADRSGVSYRSTSYLAEGAGWAEAMLDAAGDAAPPKLRARSQMALGGLLQIRLGRFDEADERLSEAQASFAQLGDRRAEAWATFYLTTARWGVVDNADLVAGFERARDLFREVGDAASESFAELLASIAQIDAGCITDATAHLDRCAELVAAHPVPNLVAHLGDTRALLAGRAGQEVDLADLARAVEGFIELGQLACVAHTTETMALWRQRSGDPAGAARLLGMARGLRDQLGMVVPAYERREGLVVDAGLDLAAHQDAFEAGRSLAIDDTIDTVRQRLGL